MVMKRICITITIIILFLLNIDCTSTEGIPEYVDGWKVIIGPPGNTYYRAPRPRPRSRSKPFSNRPKSKTKHDDPGRVERIRKNIEAHLSAYRDLFNFKNQIARLGSVPKSSDGSFRFVVMGDNRSNSKVWATIVKHINSLEKRPDFVINVGDIVASGVADEFDGYYIKTLIDNTDIPYFVAIGNHDIGPEKIAREFRYLFGENSLNYYFDYGSVRFIIIDNVTNLKPLSKTFEWLERVLAETPKNFKKCVFAHKPLGTVKRWAFHALSREYSTRFTEIMEKYGVYHVFFGHIHGYSTESIDGTEYTVTGGGGAPLVMRYGPLGDVYHYIICDVKPDGRITQRIVRFIRVEKK